MTADLPTDEFISFRATRRGTTEALRAPGVAVLHEYGRLEVLSAPPGERAASNRDAAQAPPPDLSVTEALGSAALSLRSSESYASEKEDRPHAGRSWGAEPSQSRGDGEPQPIHIDSGPSAEQDSEEPSASEAPLRPLSSRLSGRVALGLVIVSGSQPQLRFSPNDQTKVVAEVQNGLSWLADQSPARDVTFVHSIHPVTVSVPEVQSGTTYEAFEAPWRDAALVALGFPGGTAGTRTMAEKLRASLGADWAYVAFFTKYRLKHFAYALRDAARLVMHFSNDGWGPNNIDRVFAHESGHIFGAPDEYASSGCTCGGTFGHFGRPNSNCETCAPSGGSVCIMRSNDWRMCPETPFHLGYNGLPQHPTRVA